MLNLSICLFVYLVDLSQKLIVINAVQSSLNLQMYMRHIWMKEYILFDSYMQIFSIDADLLLNHSYLALCRSFS